MRDQPRDTGHDHAADRPCGHRGDHLGERPAGWMDLLQAAEFLRVSPTRLMAAVEAGQVPAHRRAGRLLFRSAEVRAALATPITPRSGDTGSSTGGGGGR